MSMGKYHPLNSLVVKSNFNCDRNWQLSSPNHITYRMKTITQGKMKRPKRIDEEALSSQKSLKESRDKENAGLQDVTRIGLNVIKNFF